MALLIPADKDFVKLNTLFTNKAENQIGVKSDKNPDYNITIDLPFDVSHLDDILFNPIGKDEKILIFKNRYFSERSFIKLRYAESDGVKNIGFIFSIRSLFENDNIFLDKREAIPYGVRALIYLLRNQAEEYARIPDIRTDLSYTFWDFYDEDLILCAISLSQCTYTPHTELSLIVSLNMFGFYIADVNELRSFDPAINAYQQKAFESLISESRGILKFKLLKEAILNEPYFDTYFRTLINKTQPPILKFLIIYQCFEALIEMVMKKEITESFTSGRFNNKTGFQIREIITEIGSESYRIGKLFRHYSKFEYGSDQDLALDTLLYLSTHMDTYTDSKNKEIGSYFYEFRNQLLHNLRVFFRGNPEGVSNKQNDLIKLINGFEFLTVEVLVGLK